MADLATLQAWLTQAETARHKLLSGSLPQTVAYNGQNQVTFARTDMAKLEAYIAELKAQIAGLTESDGRKQPRPIYFGF